MIPGLPRRSYGLTIKATIKDVCRQELTHNALHNIPFLANCEKQK
jgi:hypothetical protein